MFDKICAHKLVSYTTTIVGYVQHLWWKYLGTLLLDDNRGEKDESESILYFQHFTGMCEQG